jgi:hypothetical protein
MPTIVLTVAVVLRMLLPSHAYVLPEQEQGGNQTQKEQQSEPSKRKDDNPPIDPNKPGGARLRVKIKESVAAGKLHLGQTLSGVTDRDVRIAGQEIPKGAKVTMEVVGPKNSEPPELRLLSIEVGNETYKTHSEKALGMGEKDFAGTTENTAAQSAEASGTAAGTAAQTSTGAAISRPAGRTVVFILKAPPEPEGQNRK